MEDSALIPDGQANVIVHFVQLKTSVHFIEITVTIRIVVFHDVYYKMRKTEIFDFLKFGKRLILSLTIAFYTVNTS